MDRCETESPKCPTESKSNRHSCTDTWYWNGEFQKKLCEFVSSPSMKLIRIILFLQTLNFHSLIKISASLSRVAQVIFHVGIFTNHFSSDAEVMPLQAREQSVRNQNNYNLIQKFTCSCVYSYSHAAWSIYNLIFHFCEHHYVMVGIIRTCVDWELRARRITPNHHHTGCQREPRADKCNRQFKSQRKPI